jgi:hypothetical protein
MIDKIQTVGLAAKGVVYTFIGALTALAAFDMGGQKAGKSDTIDFLQKQPFGNFILYALAAGILAYALWKLYTAFADPKSKGSDGSGIAKRIGYGISGLIYLSFSVTIFLTTIGGGGGGGGGSKQKYAAQLMDKSWGPFLLGLIGVIIICVGLYQFYKGFSGKYLEQYNIGKDKEGIVRKAGKFGFMARGIVFGILGYLVLRAGITENPGMIEGTQGAFTFLQQFSYGWLLMGLIAIGLLGYGVFMVMVSKYSRVHT